MQFSFQGADQYLPELGSFIGSGTAQVDLRLSGNGGAFNTPLNAGSITYVYDPQPEAVPEPGGVMLMCVGLLALGATLRGGHHGSVQRCMAWTIRSMLCRHMAT